MQEQRRSLTLTPQEIEFLAYSVAAHAIWPPDQDQATLLRQAPGEAPAGGPYFRVALLAAFVAEEPQDLHLDVTPAELWLLDSILLQRDLRREKLSDGTPVVELARKVWRLLCDVYRDDLPAQLRKDLSDAGSDYTDQGAYPDADSAIARAEALLRSRHREGTG